MGRQRWPRRCCEIETKESRVRTHDGSRDCLGCPDGSRWHRERLSYVVRRVFSLRGGSSSESHSDRSLLLVRYSVLPNLPADSTGKMVGRTAGGLRLRLPHRIFRAELENLCGTWILRKRSGY